MKIENLTSLEAYDFLQNQTNSYLIDIRTIEEWRNIGIPQIKHNKIFISWPLDQNKKEIEFFKNELVNKIVNKQSHLIFLCKSGGRSNLAANYALSLGFIRCYNIIDGFEGSIYGIGWKENNLPWKIL